MKPTSLSTGTSIDGALVGRLRHIEIRYRLIGSFILLSLLPLLISGYISYVDSETAIEAKTRIFSTEVVNQVSKNVKLRMTQIDAESAQLVLSEKVQRSLTAIASGDTKALGSHRLELTQVLLDHYGALDYVNQKYFLDRNSRVLDSQVFAQLTEGVTRFVNDATAEKGLAQWGSYDNGVGQQNIGMVRTVISTGSNEPIGSIFLAIRPEHFSSIFDNVNLGLGADIFIFDARIGKIVVWPKDRQPAAAGEIYNASAMVDKMAASLKAHEDSGFVTFNDSSQEKYLAAYARIADTTWFVVNTIPASALTAEAKIVREKIELIGVLCFLFSIVLATIIARSISIPLRALMDRMHETGNLQLANRVGPVPPAGTASVNHVGQDELSRLTASFVAMNDAVNQKIAQINDINATLEQKICERTAALAASEQESRTLIENSPDSIIRYDLNCRRIFINAAVGTLALKFGVDSMRGKRPSEVPGGANLEFYEEKIREVIATGENVQFELKWDGLDGQECTHIRLAPEFDINGKLVSVLGVGRDITELNNSRIELNAANLKLARMNAMLESLATLDPLTHLPNRRLLLDRLNKALPASVRSGRHGAVLFIDLDYFKTLNDTLGHDFGDTLLQQVAARLLSCVRESDTVARIGGDEFVVMLDDISENLSDAVSQTEAIGQKILGMLNLPYQLAAHDYQISASIGASLFGDSRQTAEDLLRQADIAMYQTKRSGRNSLRFFDPGMQETVNIRAALEIELRRAIDIRQFVLHYHVQMDGSRFDGGLSPSGAEVLLRWHHPEKGMIDPNQFIRLAEETGLILPLGQWVLDTACAQLKSWQSSAATSHLVLAVNISARQFLQSDFYEQLRSLIQRHEINPRRLKLELTEGVLLDKIDETVEKMNLLNRLGVLFSLDDFGTGYSSLQYLKRLPLDQLKIDQSFVRDICVDSSDHTIVSTIIAMARSLHLNVIAEGVETPEQLALLRASDCTQFQGYLFGLPLPLEQFERSLLQDWSRFGASTESG